MKRVCLMVALVMAYTLTTAQVPVRETSPSSFTNLFQRLLVSKNLGIPRVNAAPTQRPSLLNNGADTVGAVVFNTADSLVYVYVGADSWHAFARQQSLNLLQAQLDGKQPAGNYVHLEGNEVVAGKKTFSDSLFAGISLLRGNTTIGGTGMPTLTTLYGTTNANILQLRNVNSGSPIADFIMGSLNGSADTYSVTLKTRQTGGKLYLGGYMNTGLTVMDNSNVLIGGSDNSSGDKLVVTGVNNATSFKLGVYGSKILETSTRMYVQASGNSFDVLSLDGTSFVAQMSRNSSSHSFYSASGSAIKLLPAVNRIQGGNATTAYIDLYHATEGNINLVNTSKNASFGSIRFLTDSLERARITMGGNLLVGGSADAANAQKLQITGNLALVASGGGYLYGETVNPFVRLSNSAGAQIGYSNNYFSIGGAGWNFAAAGKNYQYYRTAWGMRLSDTGATDPQADNWKAVMALTSTTKGFLPPRMTAAQMQAITGGAPGLMVFNTTDSLHYTWDGLVWKPIGNGSGSSSAPSVFASNLSDLKTKSVNAGRISMLGYNTAGDGGHADFYHDAASVLTPDDKFVVKPNSGPGNWIRIIYDGAVHIRSLGVYADGRTTEVAAFKSAVQAAAAKGLQIRYEGATVDLNGDSLVSTTPLNFYSAVRGSGEIRNGKFIVPRAGMVSEGMTYRGFTAGAIYTDTLHGGVKRPINNLWTLKFYRNNFIENQYDFREGTGAGKRDSTWATGPKLLNCEFVGNYFFKSKYASMQLDMLYSSVLVRGNIWDSTGDPASYNYTVNIGMDGKNNSNKEDGLIYEGNVAKNIIHSQAESGTFYAFLLRGRGMKVRGNSWINVGGPAYFGGDNIEISGNYAEQWRNYVKYAFTVKDVNSTGNIDLLDNHAIGYYGSGIYVETEFKQANIINNKVRLEPKDANIGVAAVRVIGDGPVRNLNIRDNELINNQTDNATNAIFLSTSGSFENVNISGNHIESKAVGLSAKLINNCTNFNFSHNPFYRSVGISTIGAQNLRMKDNNFQHLTNWMNLYIKKQAVIESNWIAPDTSLTGSTPGLLSRMFNIETDADVVNPVFNFLNNFVDKTKLTNMVRIENPIAELTVKGDRVLNAEASASAAYVSSVTSAPAVLNVTFDGFINPFNAPVLSSSTDNQTINVKVLNSRLGRDALFSFTGAGQVYQDLVINNSYFPTNPNVTVAFTNPDVVMPPGLNKRTVGAGTYTVTSVDLIKGRSNVIEATLTSPITITIPAASTTNLPLGTKLDIYQGGTGTITVAPAAGVTILSPNGLSTAGINQLIRLEKVTAPDGWRAVVLGGATGGGDTYDHSLLATYAGLDSLRQHVDSLETNYSNEFLVQGRDVSIQAIPIAKITIGGTPDGTKFLSDNGTWQVPAGGAGGGVTSFATRTGPVVPTAGDYSFGLISGTLADNQLSTNVPLKNGNNVFSGTNDFGAVTTGALATSTNSANANFNVISGSGGSTSSSSKFQFGGSTAINYRTSFGGSTTTTIAANNNYAHTVWGNMTVGEATSGTHQWIVGAVIKNFTISQAAATVNNTALLYLESNTGTAVTGDNYSLYAEGKGSFGNVVDRSLAGTNDRKVYTDANGKLKASTTNVDNDIDNYFDMVRKATISTSASTEAILLDVTVPNDSYGSGKVTVNGIDASGNVVFYDFLVRYKKVSGTLTIYPSPVLGMDYESGALSGATISLTVQSVSNDLLVNVIPGVTSVMTWRGSIGLVVNNLPAQ